MTISARTRLLAVLGDPVGQSLSPVLHNAWIAAAGLDAVYVALRMDAARAEAGFQGLRALGLAGANVTVPLKEAALAGADDVDPVARLLRAANTLRWSPEGRICAFNTDAPGFLAALDAAAPNWRATCSHALVIGAGGAARAIAWALSEDGRRSLTVVNRTRARAEVAIEGLVNATTQDWDILGHAFAQADLIVNATSLGMIDQPDPDWPMARARPGAIVVDAVYRPLETRFLAAARAQGLHGVDGLGMLVHQAALAFDIWFGVRPDVGAGRRLLLETLGEGRG